MIISEAIQLLKSYNEWRRGAETTMLSPTIIGLAIDKVIEHYNSLIKENETTTTTEI